MAVQHHASFVTTNVLPGLLLGAEAPIVTIGIHIHMYLPLIGKHAVVGCVGDPVYSFSCDP